MILELLILVVGVVVVFRLVARRGRRRARTRFRCRDCRHLIKPFDDGVLCGAGGGQVFKNPVHISNCMDQQPP